MRAVPANKIVLESAGLRDRPEGLIREPYAAAGPMHAEAAPDESRQPLEQVLTVARSIPGACDGAAIVARDDTDQIVGSADVAVQGINGFRHVAEVSIGALPGHRRAGIGRALLGGAVEVAGRLGRSLLMAVTRETVPAGEVFARRIGAGLGQVMIENRLGLRAVDRGLVRSWTDAGSSRACGYRPEFVRATRRTVPCRPRWRCWRWLLTPRRGTTSRLVAARSGPGGSDRRNKPPRR